MPDLQARVYAGQNFLAASAIRYNATNLETLDIKLPANSTPLPSEYEILTGTLAGHYAGRLGDLKESNVQQDLTYLANKTGWDARAVALAALADQFSQSQTDGVGAPAIKSAFYYALFRAGLPTDAGTLYSTDAHGRAGLEAGHRAGGDPAGVGARTPERPARLPEPERGACPRCEGVRRDLDAPRDAAAFAGR